MENKEKVVVGAVGQAVCSSCAEAESSPNTLHRGLPSGWRYTTGAVSGGRQSVAQDSSSPMEIWTTTRVIVPSRARDGIYLQSGGLTK